MAFKERYINSKEKLLNDKNICVDNRRLFKEFFENHEIKLKRKNDLRSLDEATYKTLYRYTLMFRNVNKWFENIPWKNITKEMFTKFYNDFEDGKIVKSTGKPLEDRAGYYAKIFRSIPFEMVGKKQMVLEVIDQGIIKKQKEVRFTEEETIKEIISVMIKPQHKCLTWLAFDIGENINSLLQLKKKDCVAQINPDTNHKEYRINLRKDILKRSRTPRSEITNFEETTKFLDIILRDLQENDKLFNFEYRNAEKILDRAVKIVNATCLPNGERVTWKDLRSSMACNLLKKGWNRDEVNARLGHKPNSNELNKYISFLALDRYKPKKKIFDNNLSRIQDELEKSKERERLYNQRMERLQEQMKELARSLIQERRKTL